MESIEEVNRRFNAELERYEKKEMTTNDIFHIGKPIGVLTYFLPDLPIVMRSRIVNKGTKKKHDVEISALTDMPQYLANPIFIFQRDKDTLGILTEMSDRRGRNVCVAIELGKTIQEGKVFIEVNDVRSVHGRRLENVVYPILQNGTLCWVDKEKGLAWLSSASQPVQQEIDKQDLISVTKIVQNFQNLPLKNQTTMITQKMAQEQERQKEEISKEPEYKQLDLVFDDPVAEVKYNAVDTLLEPAPLRKEVEFANVQRVFEESKAFQFSAPNKITQPRDVAYIFKQLETSAVENVFAVLVKDDKPTVIHLSMGTPRQSLVSLDSAIVADKKINADKIYFVHNHPSGSVHASPEDIALFNKWKHVFGDKLQPGIIINSRTGLFGEFSSDGHRKQSDLTLESVQPQYPIKLYSFSKLVFNKEYKEQGVIRCSSDVASFVAGHRLGARPKFSYLILSTNGSINANVHTAYSQIQQDKVRDLAQQIANDTNVFGGTVVITYGSTPLKQMQVKSLQEELKRRDIVLQDHINVQAEVNSLVMDAMGSPYKYQSASDDGWIGFMEPGMKYGKEKQEEKPVQGLNGYTREEIKEIVKNHIETIIQDAEVDAKVVGLEIHGSRGRGDARADSDLDVVVEYAGADKEYMMFNLLHSDPLYIEDLKVDVNPIRAQETGTLKEYMERSRAYDQEKLYGSDEKSQIEEANKRFNQELQLQAVGRLPRGHVYQLGMPSMVLNSAGIPNLPIEMLASRLSDKSMQENHPFGLNEVKNLVSAIQNPLAVFRSATHIGSNVILTELSHEGENFVAALRTHIQQGKIEINSVRSLYPKNNVSVAGWIENELMDYADKKRMAEWLSKQRSNSADVRKLFDHATKVVQNFENPKQHEKHPEPRYSSSIPVRRQPVVKPRKRGRGL